MNSPTPFLFKYDCACKKNQWVVRTDRQFNRIKLYCGLCITEIDAIIDGVKLGTPLLGCCDRCS